jgi:hypothetical protein
MMQSKLGLGAALVATVVASVVIAAPRDAHAEDKKAVKKIEEANAKAMEEYDLLEFENAKKLLNSALVDVKKGGLSQHPIAAKTHGNLGIVYEGLGDPDNALLEFIAALEIDGKWNVPKEYKKPELKKIYDSAKATVSGNGGGGGGGAKDAAPAPAGGGDADAGGDVSGLVHSPVEDGKEGQPISIGVKVGNDVSASQVVLYYRVQGQEDFTAMSLHHGSGPSWDGKIPASATRADSIQYYIEAKGSGGKVNASAGSRGSPNIIEIARSTGTSGGGGGGGDVDDENPLGSVGGDGTSISKKGGGGARHTVFVNVAVGSGVGFVSGNTEQSGQAVTCCVASAPFHVMPELGFWVGQKIALSAYARIGLPLGADIPGHAPAAPAGLVRLLFVFDRSGEGVSVHGDVGGGFIRHNIKLIEPFMDGTVDTVATGPLLIGGGAAWAHTLGGPLRFVLDLNILTGIPVAELGGVKPYFSINADLNIGFQLAF